eukprot:Pompholyxophrys_punicea_v1_NODE_391_length_2066_cov_5.975706.p1 type:complete len:564 gc:universal NODE_391_length_2066_cov_5.975706:1769-78(-)
MAYDLVSEIRMQGLKIEYCTAPYESDAQLVYLCREKLIDAVLGEDADFLAAGCPLVITKLTLEGNCEVIFFDDILKLDKFSKPFQFSAVDILHLCILSGCDYFKIPRVGMSTAYEAIIRHEGNIDLILKELKIGPDLLGKFALARKTFTSMPVFCPQRRALFSYNPENCDEIGCPFFDNSVACSVADCIFDPLTHVAWVDHRRCNVAMTINKELNPNILTEHDIPGASLDGCPPAALTAMEMQTWLKCRGLDCSGTRADMLKLILIAEHQDLEIFDISGSGLYRAEKIKRLESCNGIDYGKFPLLKPFPRLPVDNDWLDESTLIRPETPFIDLTEITVKKYLLEMTDADGQTRDNFRAHDEGQNLFSCGHLGPFLFHPARPGTRECFVTAKVLARQRAEANEVAVIVDVESNMPTRALCKCKAGRSECCIHISCLLHGVTALCVFRNFWKKILAMPIENRPCTSMPCIWRVPSSLLKGDASPVINLDFTDHRKKARLDKSKPDRKKRRSHQTELYEFDPRRNEKRSPVDLVQNLLTLTNGTQCFTPYFRDYLDTNTNSMTNVE